MRTTISPGQWQPWTTVSPLYVNFSAVIGMLSKPSWIPLDLEILFQASEKKINNTVNTLKTETFTTDTKCVNKAGTNLV